MEPLMFLLFISTVCGKPLMSNGPTETPNVVRLQKDLELAVFVQDFKSNLAQYINNQYRNLTFAEMDNVKDVLEKFLTTFADDLRHILENKDSATEEHSVINDGLPESTFDEIKAAITAEFLDIDEMAARKIVYKLRQNLNNTKHAIDNIIRASQKAQFEYSLIDV